MADLDHLTDAIRYAFHGLAGPQAPIAINDVSTPEGLAAGRIDLDITYSTAPVSLIDPAQFNGPIFSIPRRRPDRDIQRAACLRVAKFQRTTNTDRRARRFICAACLVPVLRARDEVEGGFCWDCAPP